MNEQRKRAVPHAGPPESTVYLGRDAVGSIFIVRKGQEVAATDAAGKRLGIFESDRAAMAAILRKARETAR